MDASRARSLLSSRDIVNSMRCPTSHMNGFLLNFATPCPLLSWKRRVRGLHYPHINHRGKKSVFQDFQGFAEPSRLLPVTTAKFCPGLNLEEILAFADSKLPSIYIVQLSTSNDFGSNLMDSDAAILLSLIDTDGNSVLQRISAALLEDLSNGEEMPSSKEMRFQRGSVETITFQGPKMGKVNAVWIGLESGSWRLGNASLIVINSNGYAGLKKDSKEVKYSGLRYDFEVDDILLGEGANASMTELRPKSIIDFSMDNNSNLFNMPFPYSTSKRMPSREESMKSYMNLKLSSLVYDAVLVSAGGAAFSASISEKASSAFLFGGLCGFVYLLLLQKSVDGLSTSTLSLTGERDKSDAQALGRFKGSFLKLAFILVSSAAVVKYGLENNTVEVAPLEFLIGVLGFFTSRVAVLFAAFKPIGMEK